MLKKIIYVFFIMFPLLFASFFQSHVFALSGVVTSEPGGRIDPTNGVNYEEHAGLDVGGIEEGTDIDSPVSGTVIWAGNYDDGYGNSVVIRMDNYPGIFRLGHNSDVTVMEGEHVSVGQIIAHAGSTGKSTGVHVHAEWRPDSYGLDDSYNPNPFDDPRAILEAGGWKLDGSGTNTKTPLTGVKNFFLKAIPGIDINYQGFFAPYKAFNQIAEKIMNIIITATQNLIDSAFDTLVLLCILNLMWFGMKASIGEEDFTLQAIIPKVLKIILFLALWKAWPEIVRTLGIPSVTALAGAFSDKPVTSESFTSFDLLFNQLALSLQNYMHLKWHLVSKMNLGPFLIYNFCIITILIFAIEMCLFILRNLIIFYIYCMIGVLGLPLSMIPVVNEKGGTFLGAILSQLFYLIVIVFIYTMIISAIGKFNIIRGDSVADLIIFTGTFVMCSWFLQKGSTRCISYFESLRFNI